MYQKGRLTISNPTVLEVSRNMTDAETQFAEKARGAETMNLADALNRIKYDPSWAIYAEYPLTPESDCRYGQTQFENGGLLDDKEFIINGESANDRISNQIDPEDGDEDYQREIAIETLIDELNEEQQ